MPTAGAGARGNQLHPAHNTIDSADLAIAATTILNGSRLLTSNVRHFPVFRTYARRTDTANRPPCRGTVLAAPSGRWPLDVAASRPGSASALLDRANTLTNEPQPEVPGAGVAGRTGPARRRPARCPPRRSTGSRREPPARSGPSRRHRHVSWSSDARATQVAKVSASARSAV